MYKEITEELLQRQKILLGRFHERLKKSPEGELYRKTGRRGRHQFYHKLPGKKPVYINRRNQQLVHELKFKALLEKGAVQLERNIAVKEQVQQQYGPCDYPTLNGLLPEKYRDDFLPEQDAGLWEDQPVDRNDLLLNGFTPSQNPFRRHELIHTTTFGLHTRSKGEAMIAEMLYMLGVPFHYEKEIELVDEYGLYHSRYPDFTIPLWDERKLFWEHKGLFQNMKYRERDEKTMVLYHRNGIYEPKNLIVTMDGPEGDFHADAVMRVINGLILPQMQRPE